MKKIVFSLSAATLLLGTPNAQAAFIPRSVEMVTASGTPTTTTPETLSATSSETVTQSKILSKTKKLSFFKKVKNFFDAPGGKDQGLAAVLALFFGSIGIHRFYLGRSGSGALQFSLLLIGLMLISAGGPFAFFTGAAATKLSGATAVGMIVLLGQSIWVLVDFIRIITGDLKPKGSSYRKTPL